MNQGITHDLTTDPGVYILTHVESGKSYVGSAKNVAQRIYQHYSLLRGQRHPNKNLQAAYDQCSTLSVAIMSTIDREVAYDKEQATINRMLPQGLLFNIGIDARKPSKGRTHSPETIARMSVSRRSWTMTDEHRQTMSRTRMGKRMGVDNACSKRVSVDGVIYTTCDEAAKTLGITRSTFSRWLNSTDPKYSGYVTL